MHVCIPCRNVVGWGLCQFCGEPRVSSPYKWSPPSKNNDEAWRRIAKGEWLWDRRRVRRNPPPAIYDKGSWFSLPTHKKGQRKIFQNNVPRKRGPDVDMGG